MLQLCEKKDVNPGRRALRFEGSKIETTCQLPYHVHCTDGFNEIDSFI